MGIISTAISMTAVFDGENNVRLDLTNEADLIACDSQGKVRFTRVITTTAKIYDGSTAATSNVSVPSGYTVANYAIAGHNPASIAITNGVLILQWTFSAGDTLSTNPSYTLSIPLVYNGVTYSAVFTLTRTDASAIYQVQPDPSAVSFSLGTSNTLVPSSIGLKFFYTKETGSGSTTVQATNGNIIDSLYYPYYRIKKSNSWSAWTKWSTAISGSGITWSSGTAGIPNSTEITDVELGLSPASSSPADSSFIDREVVPVIKDGINGTSPWLADLDNEMDSVGCTSDGEPLMEQSVSTTAMLYYGSTKQNISFVKVVRRYGANNASTDTWTTSGGKLHEVTVSWNASTGKVTISYTTNAKVTNKDLFEITIKDSENTSGDMTLVFTVNAIVGLTLYSLVPSASTISKRESGGTVTYDPASVSCGYTKFDVASGQTTAGTGGTIKYKPDGGAEATYTRALVPGTDFTSYVTFLLYMGTSVVDVETINIVADGDDGKDAAVVEFSRNPVLFDAEYDGTVQATTTSFVVMLSVNGSYATLSSITNIAVTGSSLIVASSSGGSAVTSISGLSGTSKTLYLRLLSASTQVNGTVSMTVNGTLNGESYTANGTFTTGALRVGQTGDPGHVGRFYYYAGEYAANTPYRMEKTQCPFVKASDGSFYMLDYAAVDPEYEESSTATGIGTNKNPAAAQYQGGNPWTLMSSAQKYYIAEAFFGNYAHLGSFIVNGDWMLSQQGIQYNPSGGYSSSSAYTYFNKNHPNDWDGGTNFCPNFCFDAKTGKAYMNDAYIKGTVYASNGYFKGGIFAPLLRISDATIGNYATPLGSGSYRMSSFPTNVGGMQFETTSTIYIELPAVDASQNGREFEILNLSSSAAATITVRTTNSYGPATVLKQYHYLKIKVIYDAVAMSYVWMKIAAMNINRGLATGDTEDGAHVEIGNVVSV